MFLGGKKHKNTKKKTKNKKHNTQTPPQKTNYKVLITKAPPAPETEAQKLRAQLIDLDIPVFGRDIPRLKIFDRAFESGVKVAEVKGDPNVIRAWSAYFAI